MTILETQNLRHVYGAGTPFERTALSGVDLKIEAGEMIGVIGHTGSGKSTLLQHFNALCRPTSGKVLFQGEDIWQKKYDLRALRFSVGLVFQYPEYQLFEETVGKDVAFAPRNMGLSESEIDARVREALRFVGLDESVLNKSPFDLSGGQKRRVAIAGVIAMRPSVLILDEPTAGLDPRGRDEILAQIRDYHQASGATVILVSHRMEDVAQNAQRVLVMDQGRAALFAPPREVFAHADELVKMGLDVPQITRVFMRLRAAGYGVDASVFSAAQAADEIARLRR